MSRVQIPAYSENALLYRLNSHKPPQLRCFIAVPRHRIDFSSKTWAGQVESICEIKDFLDQGVPVVLRTEHPLVGLQLHTASAIDIIPGLCILYRDEKGRLTGVRGCNLPHLVLSSVRAPPDSNASFSFFIQHPIKIGLIPDHVCTIGNDSQDESRNVCYAKNSRSQEEGLEHVCWKKSVVYPSWE